MPESNHTTTPAEWVAKQLADAPPLTDEQRIALAELLAPIRRSRRGGAA